MLVVTFAARHSHPARIYPPTGVLAAGAKPTHIMSTAAKSSSRTGSLYSPRGWAAQFVLINPEEVESRACTHAHQRLAHGVDLIVIGTVREGRTLVDEALDPWGNRRIRQIDIASLDLRADRVR